MGKGDRRTKRGKIFRGTFGKTRPRKKKKSKVIQQVSKLEQTDSSETKE